MQEKKIAVVIPFTTMNDYVHECIVKCLNLDYGNLELVLVPDTVLERNDPRVLVVPSGAGASIGAKRNIGIKGAGPDVGCYALIDSDAFPHADWLNEAICAFGRDDSIWAVGGPNLAPPGAHEDEKPVATASLSVMVSGNMAFAKRNDSAKRYVKTLHACNLIVSAEAIRRCGLFNEDLQTGEDREFCHRLIKNGGRILFHPSVAVYHHSRRQGAGFLMQKIVHGHSIYAIMRADPSTDNIALFIPPVTAVLTLTAILAGPFGRLIAVCAIGAYGLAAAIESIRHSESLSEAPATFKAIITANAGYLLGTITGLSNVRLNLRKLYRNHPG